jgi:hypothetical protein
LFIQFFDFNFIPLAMLAYEIFDHIADASMLALSSLPQGFPDFWGYP